MATTPENTSEASTGNETHGIVDQTSPYFLHALDSPDMNLVLTPFDGSGYGAWRRSVLIALSAKNKLIYIEASSVTPSSHSSEYKMWSRCNDMVTSWLLNSLLKEIAGSVIYSKSAKELWKDLEDRFGQPNGATLYHLQKQLADLVQGSLDIAAYYTKMKKIWDELDTLYTKVTCSCACDCGGKDKMDKSLQDERLVQFLMGLNDVYAPGKINILMMSPLPSVNLAYSLLMQDEKQRESYMNTNFPRGSSSFLASQHYPMGQRSSSADFKGKKMELVCSNCKKLGHTVDKCFRIIGFPANFKFTNNKSQSMRSNAAISSAATENRAFTQDQMMQMMQMFQMYITSPPASPRVRRSTSSAVWMHFERDPSVKIPLVLGEARDGVFLLSTSINQSKNFLRSSVSLNQCISVSSVSPIPVSYQSDVHLWHIRLGHMPFNLMKKFSFISSTQCVACRLQICPLARQTKLPFPQSSIKTKNIFELIHIDTWGPYKTATYNGFKYFLTIVDDFSRAIWTYLLSAKSNAFSMLKYFMAMVEKQFGAKIKYIRFPSSVLKGKTPYEILFGNAPDYSFLKSFGFLCFVSIPILHRAKFEPRASPCVFLGYPTGKKGYKVMDLKTKRVFVSRDVQFHEHSYPFSIPMSTLPTHHSQPSTLILDDDEPKSSIPNVTHSHVSDSENDPIVDYPAPSTPTHVDPLPVPDEPHLLYT
ncbi:uncharacterized protein LOC132639200 [Lycium barbarum]|uniref:uncharacterized protein LOC132639200 n=1 Tax=Lycium barbarum TaxID=112863 RepID=UPI00293E21B1|nr:uncharacterized protein LOC132639200 [Lycium barbarum]